LQRKLALRELVCDTSPLQYLHQLRHFDLLRRLADRVLVPPAVVSELAAGRSLGYDVPVVQDADWISVRAARTTPPDFMIAELGAGESQVIMLALESPDAIAVLDDRGARRA
jgi:uncharacterized protein